MEVIVSAATRKDGKVFTGRNHGEINVKTAGLFTFEGRPVSANFNGEQGFIARGGVFEEQTEYERFVDRKEAAQIALKAGQIDKLHYFKDELDSSDINRFSIDGSTLYELPWINGKELV